jgi:peptidoglycan/xylan/chitin deacetylase (PgdA/CDA1 family)
MRRLLCVSVTLVLAVTGCTRGVTAARPTAAPSSAGPSTSGPSTPEPSTAAPTAEPTAPPTPSPTTPSPSLTGCAGPAVAMNRTASTAIGLNGSHKTTGSLTVALTFDDGPDPVNTPRILDVLAQCGVKATFCVLGYRVVSYPDVIRRIVAEGHTLCNHSWRHIMQLGTYGPTLIRDDLHQTNDAIHAIVPGAPIRYFRAPGGFWSADYVSVAHDLGMTPIDWEVDPRDWDFNAYGTGQGMTAHIIANVEANVRPGSIVLSHDYEKPATTAAYRVLLPWLVARFQLVALPTGPLP